MHKNVVSFTYHAISDELQQEGSDNGAEKLSNPVVDGADEGDPSTKKNAKGDGRIHMASLSGRIVTKLCSICQ